LKIEIAHMPVKVLLGSLQTICSVTTFKQQKFRGFEMDFHTNSC